MEERTESPASYEEQIRLLREENQRLKDAQEKPIADIEKSGEDIIEETSRGG